MTVTAAPGEGIARAFKRVIVFHLGKKAVIVAGIIALLMRVT